MGDDMQILLREEQARFRSSLRDEMNARFATQDARLEERGQILRQIRDLLLGKQAGDHSRRQMQQQMQQISLQLQEMLGERKDVDQGAEQSDAMCNGIRRTADTKSSYEGGDNLAGVKVLHGLEKVIEGGAVVLTLSDQNILTDGDINKEVEVLENVEIGEQQRRDGAYKVAQKQTRIYDDKFNDDPASEKKILLQYDELDVVMIGLALAFCVIFDPGGLGLTKLEDKLDFQGGSNVTRVGE